MSLPIVFILISQVWLLAGFITYQSAILQSLPWLLAGIFCAGLEYLDRKELAKKFQEELETLKKLADEHVNKKE